VFLNSLSTRLIDHADSITNVAAHDMEIDIRLASPCVRPLGWTAIPCCGGCRDGPDAGRRSNPARSA
jgi:hypothetical protein